VETSAAVTEVARVIGLATLLVLAACAAMNQGGAPGGRPYVSAVGSDGGGGGGSDGGSGGM
jgi:hypothetical protein